MIKASTLRAVLGPLVLILCSCGIGETYQEDLGKQSQAIVGGNEAWLNSAVAVTTTQCQLPAANPAVCSALLISPTTVITARHCVSFSATSSCPAGVDPSKLGTFRVAVGCHDIVNNCPAANWKALASIVTYPGSDHDIAILHLAQAVTIKPTRLASPARVAEIKAGDSVTLYGWGMAAQNGYMSPVLKSFATPIQSIPLVQPGIQTNPQTFAATCETNPYVGTNYGDSGGPTLVLRDGEWFTVGVTQGGSYGSSWTQLGLVPYYFNWILSQGSDFPAQSWLPSAQIAAVEAILS